MVAQIASDSGHVLNDVDSHLVQVTGRANARQHEKVGRTDGSTGENDLVSLVFGGLSIGLDLHADCPPSFKEDSP